MKISNTSANLPQGNELALAQAPIPAAIINHDKSSEIPEQLHQIAENITPDKNETSPTNKTSGQIFYDFLRKNLPIKGAYITAILHSVAALQYIFNSKSKKRMDSTALNTSKVILSSNCLIQTYEAMKENRIWEGGSRFLEPLFILAENRVEDLGLARGIGLGISQMVESQDGIYQEIAKSKKLNPESISMGQDHDINWTACKKLFRELMIGGLGSGRRFMTAFTFKNIKESLSEAYQNFSLSAFTKPFGSEYKTSRERIQAFFDLSGLTQIKKLCVGDSTKDKGHTTALSGAMMILGSVIGYMGKGHKNILYKLGGTLRNVGGMVGDVGIMGHPDVRHNLSAPFLFVNGIFDIAQRFVPSTWTRLIKAMGNISMAFYNIGVAIYLDRSNDKTNEKKQIKRFDTDLKTTPTAQFQLAV